MKLESLFRRCLNIEYTHTEHGGDYAFEKIGDTLYIYFEHSRGEGDWKINLDFPVKPYKRMGKSLWLAHRGFLSSFKNMEKYIYPLIMDASVSHIVIVGYSHGGALAVLCHEFAWYNRRDCKIEGYGFGAPRVIWGFLFGKHHRWDNFTVIRNIDDIVTHLPPALFGYRHVGSLLKIGKKGKYSVTDAHRQENILRELRNSRVDFV